MECHVALDVTQPYFSAENTRSSDMPLRTSHRLRSGCRRRRGAGGVRSPLLQGCRCDCECEGCRGAVLSMAQVPMRLRPLQWRNGWPVHRMAASLPGGRSMKARNAFARVGPMSDLARTKRLSLVCLLAMSHLGATFTGFDGVKSVAHRRAILAERCTDGQAPADAMHHCAEHRLRPEEFFIDPLNSCSELTILVRPKILLRGEASWIRSFFLSERLSFARHRQRSIIQN